MAGRRPGDSEVVYAATEKAERELNWKNRHSTICFSLDVVGKKVEHPDPTRHFQSRLDLQLGPDPEPAESISNRGANGERLPSSGKRERLNGKRGGHILGLAGADLSGGDEHEADLGAGVEELKGAVVVGEDGAVRVLDGDVLGEGEIDGGIGGGESGELDGVDGDEGLWGKEEENDGSRQ
nr:UDP-glucose 4-epimerase GEPI48-like [Ipomoea batatas]